MWDIGFTKTRGVIKRFYRKESSPIRILATRIAVIIIILLVVAGIFWYFEKDHIHDDTGGEFSYIDSLYFTIVTVTTLGYGDIVPVTEEARMFDAVIITPVRMIVWILLIGTAYQLVVRNYWEEYKMNKALKNMKDHTIVAGYDTTGAATVKELLLKGYHEDNLIVIESKEELVKAAADSGATGILGDPTSEDTLIRAGIKNANVLIIATPQDDTNVLIALTAKDLNPSVKIVSRVSQLENMKQLKRAGADVMISPSLTGGNLMAMAVTSSNSVELIEDLLTTSRGVNVIQRKVNRSELGKTTKDFRQSVVIGVVRGGKIYGPRELDKVVLKENDEIILIG